MKRIAKLFILVAIVMIFGFNKADKSEIKEGQSAIDFTLSDQDGNSHKLSDYKGEYIVIYFFPKAHTPG